MQNELYTLSIAIYLPCPACLMASGELLIQVGKSPMVIPLIITRFYLNQVLNMAKRIDHPGPDRFPGNHNCSVRLGLTVFKHWLSSQCQCFMGRTHGTPLSSFTSQAGLSSFLAMLCRTQWLGTALCV